MDVDDFAQTHAIFFFPPPGGKRPLVAILVGDFQTELG
jgi:hypothetical protein